MCSNTLSSRGVILYLATSVTHGLVSNTIDPPFPLFLVLNKKETKFNMSWKMFCMVAFFSCHFPSMIITLGCNITLCGLILSHVCSAGR